MELKKELCNKLIEENLVEEGDMIVHSYANNRLTGKRPINTVQNKDKNVSAVLTTRPDTLGIVVNDASVNRIGGLFDTEEQTRQAGSIYDTEGLAPNIDTMQGGYRQPLVPQMFNPYNEKEIEDIAPTQTTQCGSRTSSAAVLVTEPVLVGGVGEKVSNNGTQYYQQDRVYDANAVALCQSANENFNPWYAVAQRKREEGHNIEVSDREYANAITTIQTDSMVGEPQSCLIQPIDRDYQKKGEKRETHVETKTDGTSHALRTNGETMTTNGLRIRKLTPKECWRLMYWDDESFEKAEKVNSNSALYKQAGNGICVNVMSAIFKELL